MRIGILGSWRPGPGEWGLRGTKGQFDSACITLGRALAQAHQSIIVGGESDSTADSNVVRRFLDVIEGVRPHSPLIEVLSPLDDNRSYQSLAEKYPGVFGFHLQTQSRWTETHLLTVREADSVLVIGGMKGTYHAGLAAIVARKTLIPVGGFGGAASRLLRDLANAKLGFESKDLIALNAPWTNAISEIVLRCAGIGQRPQIMIVHGRSSDFYELQAWMQREGFGDVAVMQQDFGNSRTFAEKFEQIATVSDGAVALVTPDDVGAVAGEVTLQNRARQNVWVEVGWFWGRLGRSRLLLLLKGDIEVPSDLLGVEFYRYEKSPVEQAEKLRSFARRLSDCRTTADQ